MIAPAKHPKDRTTDYAKRVVAGKIVAGRLVRLACERHLRDLKDGKARGLRFDKAAAAEALDFFGCLRLPEGDAAFDLQPWQAFIVGSLFGWKGSDGYRRFRTAYIEAGKGSGKSPLAAGIGLLGLIFDGEPSAEVYSAAVTREQASIVFRDAKRMAEASPTLAKRLDIGLYNIAHTQSGSFFRPVSSEHRGLDGKRVHIGLIDELHEHPNSLVVDKIRAGTKGRKQALIFKITNSGHDRTTVCWRDREYSEKVLQGILEDDSLFSYVCALDPCEACRAEGKTMPTDTCPNCDHWTDEAVWLKVCPNLGVSVTEKYLREQVREAQGMPAKENIVKRLNFCIWTETADHCIPMDAWDACAKPIDLKALEGRSCYGGLDIGATSDFTAFVLMFPHDDAEPVEQKKDMAPDAEIENVMRRSFTMLAWFWLPARSRKRDASIQQIIELWKKQGFIKVTDGEVVDYDQVVRDIVELSRRFTLQGLAFDRGFQGTHTGTMLQSEFGTCVEAMPAGILSMSPPFREFQELLKTRRLHHDGNPVLRWMASNVAADERQGLVMPSKDKSTEKIDGITAGVLALAFALRETTSIYSEGGNLAL
jgi:phage terminase large subunit-like protein